MEEEDDEAALRRVAEEIAHRTRRRILIGLALLVALCIGLAFMGPPPGAQRDAVEADKVEAGTIP
jgi:hypothetical protein